jgi:hypothetical protein
MTQINNKLLAYTLQGPGIKPTANPAAQLETIISGIIGVMTIIGVIYFTLQIILAGFTLISSQGDKKRLTNSVLGLAIVVLAYGLGALLASLLGMNNIFDLQTFFKQIN